MHTCLSLRCRLVEILVLNQRQTTLQGRGQQGVVAIFTRRGEKIYCGNPRGNVIIIDTATRQKIKEISVATGNSCAIKSLAFSQEGDAYIINSMDRNIRVYRTEDDECENTFKDVVNMVQWKVIFLFTSQTR